MTLRAFDPLKADHPLVGNERCPLCTQLFASGDVVALVPTPTDEERKRMEAGRPCTAIAAPVHHACASKALRALGS